MIITYKNVEALAGKEWMMAEIASAHTAERVIKRLCGHLPKAAGNEPVELFIPLVKRDLDVFELEGGNYFYARSSKDAIIWRFKMVTGITGCVVQDDTGRMGSAIRVDDAWVQGRIMELENKHKQHADSLRVGYFVRILDGECRDLAGTVTALTDKYATVLVELKTRQMTVETPRGNLLRLDVPKGKRVWYYSSPLDAVDADAVKEDLHHVPLPAYVQGPVTYKAPKQFPTTTSKLSMKLAKADPNIKPRELAKKLLEAAARKEVQYIMPRSLYTFIKIAIRAANPKVKGWHELRKTNSAYRFGPDDVRKFYPKDFKQSA